MKKIIVILILATFILLAQPVLAADLGPILPPCAANGRCSLCDLIQVGVNFGEFLFAISGALLLLFIFYGGFLMLVSGGNPQTVGKGKSAMVNAVIGILIVFTAYMGVNFIIMAVTTKFDWKGNLQCKPLPESVGWTAGIIGQGAGGAGTGGGTAPSTPTAPAGPTITPAIPCTCTSSDGSTIACSATACPSDCFYTGSACIKKRPIGGYPCSKHEQCLNGWCNFDPNVMFCVGPAGSQPEGQFCTRTDECKQTPDALVCIALKANGPTGNCSKPLSNGSVCGGLYLPHKNAVGISTDELACVKRPDGRYSQCNSLGYCQY